MAAARALVHGPGAVALVSARRAFASAAEAPVRLAPRCWRASWRGTCPLAEPLGPLKAGFAAGSTRGAASSSSPEADPYEVLGVPRTATADDIKAAYRKQALKWHPDRHPEDQRKEAERKFAAAASAYEILSDPQKRRQHDSGGSSYGGGAPTPHGGFPAGGFPGGFHSQESAERLFREVFGAHGFDEIFQQLLGGNRAALGTLQVGQEVAVLKEGGAVIRACREAGIDAENDALRKRCLGKIGKIVKADPKDQTVKVSIAGVGDVWFSAKAVRPMHRGGGDMPGFQTGPFSAFGSMGAGAGPGTVTMRQEVVVRPDGSRVMRVTRTTRGPDGKSKQEVFETPMQ